MSNLLLLFTCLVAGVLLRRSGRVADGGHQALNAAIIHLALPALTLRTLHGFDFEPSHGLPVVMPWLLFALGALLFALAGRCLGLQRAQIGALTLVGGLGNTSFVGLPMIETLHGRDGHGAGPADRPAGLLSGARHLGRRRAPRWYAGDGRNEAIGARAADAGAELPAGGRAARGAGR
jgi:hypothetical protein